MDGEEADGEEHFEEEDAQEPEAEMNQITMMVREDDDGTTSCQRTFESAGCLSVRSVQVTRFEWLVDSGATCHILSEKWIKQHKITHEYKGSPPIWKSTGFDGEMNHWQYCICMRFA